MGVSTAAASDARGDDLAAGPDVGGGGDAAAVAADDCYRCGYVLQGIADDQPCPECGLLAARSRRATDELFDTRPSWLRKLSWGTWILLLTILVTAVWPLLLEAGLEFLSSSGIYWSPGYRMHRHLPWMGFNLAVLLLPLGVWLLTGPEGYPPADRADRRLRRALRIVSFVPLVALAMRHFDYEWYTYNAARMTISDDFSLFGPIPPAVAAAGCLSLPLLLACRMRGLAKRARSAHLAEHCVIVGVGVTGGLVYFAVCAYVFEHARELGLGGHFSSKGTGSLVLITIMATLVLLFMLWSVYLLIRFAIAFGRASSKLRGKWRREDRSVLFAG